MSPPAVSVKQDTRQLLLETGLSILVEHGYNATSINDVLQAVNVPKGSFYHYFESKEAFCDEILSYYEALKSEEFQQLFENERITPLNRLRTVLLKIMGQMEADAFQTGCLIGNLGQEMSAQSPRLRAKLDAIYGRWQERHYRCFEAAQAVGELPLSIELSALVPSYLMAFQGAILEAKITRSVKSFQVFNWLFFEQLARPKEKLSLEEEVQLSL